MPFGPKVHALPMATIRCIYAADRVDGFGQLALDLDDGSVVRVRMTLDTMRELQKHMPTEYHDQLQASQSSRSSGSAASETSGPVGGDNV